MKTYEQALKNQWAVAYHRTAFAKEAEKDGRKDRSCDCKDCKEHLEALKLGKEALREADGG
jgi:hypothetical protein